LISSIGHSGRRDARLRIGMSRQIGKRASHPDVIDSARTAGLHYVDSTVSGFRRRRSGKGFCYFDVQGRLLRNPVHLKRIRSLVIPPAWRDVWICPTAQGHLQAVGYDERGRRQYRYHPAYRTVRDETKFARMPAFALALPRIRQHVNHDLARPDVSREKVLASVVRLLEITFIRIGNMEYARDNESFGLTTLRNRHAEIDGSTIRFRFRGKSGIDHEVEIRDRRIARVVKACHDLPGYHLFEYVDEEGVIRTISSGDVNAYIRGIAGEEFTAKDFRTWAGTVQTALALASIGGFENPTQAKRNVVAAIKDTAKRLGNRPATCRKYYVHPAVIDAYLQGTLLPVVRADASDTDRTGLYPEERCALRLIGDWVAPTSKVA
jgi:DNA topoisomerase-1